MEKQSHVKMLVNAFVHPVFVVDNELNIVSVNNAFEQDKYLSDHINKLIDTIPPLLTGEQDLIYWQLAHYEKRLTAIPMTQNLTLINIATSKPSTLAQRYTNLVNLIDQMSDAVIICTNEHNVDLTNEQFQKTFPFSRTLDHKNRKITDFLCQVLEVIFPQNKTTQLLYFRYLRLQIHRNNPLLLSFSLPNGQYFQYRDKITYTGERIGLLINESKFKAINDQLENAITEANALSQAKSAFMASMSHEVRTPLNAIIGLLDLCSLEPQLQNHDYLKRMSQSAASLFRLVNDVLDFSKFDAKKVELTPSITNLRKLCESVLLSFSGQAKNCSLTLFVDPCLPKEIFVDEIRLNQILSNLISNGLKFNNKTHPELSLIVEPDKLTKYTTFTVEDNGIGIIKSEQQAIFNVFSQANNSIHGKYGGTGLGLSICQKICQLMQGEIHVESEMDKGSKFIVQLPLENCSEKEIDSFDLKVFSNTLFSTNDPDFYKSLELYKPSLAIQTKLYSQLPNSLALSEIICINPDLFNKKTNIDRLPENQIVYISDNIQNDFKQYHYVIHRSPFLLSELLRITSGNIKQSIESLSKNIFPHQSQIRALVVEDNFDNMYVLKKQFNLLGVKTCFAMSAEDAVIFFEQQQFDIVISDYQMPGVSGAELFKILRELEKVEHKKPATMLILTADRTPHCRTECLASGANDILLKPLVLRELSELITNTEIRLAGNVKPSSRDLTKLEASELSVVQVENNTFFIDERSTPSLTGNTNLLDLHKLREVIGAIASKEEINYLNQFAKNLGKVISKMEHEVENQNWTNLGKLAHSLKSSSMIVGAIKLSSQCEAIELAAHQEGSETTLRPLWEKTREFIEILLGNINEHCNNHE